jgi:uroporphyrinogen decarboxylase
MMTLTHRERLQACLADDPALDHPPVALWRHFPVDDQNPEALAAATLDFQHHYDFDLVKVTPASSFSIKDWGAEDVWEGHSEGTRRYTRRVIDKPQDWERLSVLSPSSPYLSKQLACLRYIRADLSSDTPLLQTIFSPLAQAKNLAGGDRLVVHLRQHPEAVLKGLETIAETTRLYVEACMELGIRPACCYWKSTKSSAFPLTSIFLNLPGRCGAIFSTCMAITFTSRWLNSTHARLSTGTTAKLVHPWLRD